MDRGRTMQAWDHTSQVLYSLAFLQWTTLRVALDEDSDLPEFDADWEDFHPLRCQARPEKARRHVTGDLSFLDPLCEKRA